MVDLSSTMEKCSICLLSFRFPDTERWQMLVCNHSFCRICIPHLLKNHSAKLSICVCPLCRKECFAGYAFKFQDQCFKVEGNIQMNDLANKFKSLGNHIEISTNSKILLYADDCRNQKHEKKELGQNPEMPCDWNHRHEYLISFLSWNVCGDDSREKKESDESNINKVYELSIRSPKENDQYYFILKMNTGLPLGNIIINMYPHRLIHELYKNIYSHIFGPNTKEKTHKHQKLTAAIIFKGRVIDPESKNTLSYMVRDPPTSFNGPTDPISLFICLVSPEYLAKKLDLQKPEIRTCTGYTMELIQLYFSGLIKECIYAKEMKSEDLCAQCLLSLTNETGRGLSVEPAQLRCSHLIHVDCLFEHLQLDSTKKKAFFCNLCKDLILSK